MSPAYPTINVYASDLEAVRSQLQKTKEYATREKQHIIAQNIEQTMRMLNDIIDNPASS